MKVAFAHDYLNQYGGAERVLEVLHSLFPKAPVYTLIFDRTRMPRHFQEWNIRESFLRKFPFEKRHYEKYFLLMPLAVESFSLNEFDLVISISSAWSKGLITLPSTYHINYMLNPMRFAWDSFHPLINARGGLGKLLLVFGLHYVRLWDENTRNRPDKIVAISNTVAKRIEKFYKISPLVIYPPVNTDFFTLDPKMKKEEFFLIVSRLRPYKRIDIAIEAFNMTKLPLLIIGEGSLKAALRRKAHPNIQFLGRKSDEEVRNFYRRAKALIFPTFEDFGIVPLEACACGTPVIAFGEGGATETIVEGKSGTFFNPQTSEALAEVLLNFHAEDYDAETVRKQAMRFSTEEFVKKFRVLIDDVFKKRK
jgi:glycosyltransferase involved in cell wall biosynthesis